MAVQDMVRVLTEYCERGEEAFRELHGPEATIAVRDTIDIIEGQLSTQLEYDALWDDFAAAPRETRASMAGALEAMIEADPGLADHMEMLLEAYYDASQSTGETPGGMPESEASEFTTRRDAPIERHEVEPRTHEDVFGEGTYLYGNVRAGEDVAVEKSVELSPEMLESHRELEMMSPDVSELFDQLRATVDQEPGLDDEEKSRLQEELKALEAELMLEDEGDEEQVLNHLRRVGEIHSGFLGLLLTGLGNTRSQARGMVEKAIERMEEDGG